MEEAEFVDETRIHLGEEVARVGAGFAPVFPREGRGDHRALLRESELWWPDRVGQRLAREFREGRFVVVAVELREPTLEENVEDAFRGGPVMEFGQGRAGSPPSHHIRRGDGAETEEALPQPVTAREWAGLARAEDGRGFIQGCGKIERKRARERRGSTPRSRKGLRSSRDRSHTPASPPPLRCRGGGRGGFRGERARVR